MMSGDARVPVRFFRPPLHPVRGILSRTARPTVTFCGTTMRVEALSEESLLVRISSRDLDVLQEARGPLTLRMHGEPVYQGPARVHAIYAAERRAELDILGPPLDLVALVRRDARLAALKALDAFPARPANERLTAYLDLLRQVVLFLQHHRSVLSRHEQRILEHGGVDMAEEIDALCRDAFARIQPDWEALRLEGNRVARPILDIPDEYQTAREITENSLTPLLIEAPILDRVYTRPLGFPGDYQVMLYSYANAFEGPTAFARTMHKLIADHPLSRGARSRMELVVDLIVRHIRSSSRVSRTWRITNLGCGPAMEIPEVASRLRDVEDRLLWTLIDQEPQALKHAHGVARRTQQEYGADRVAYQSLCMSFTHMLSGAGSPEPQDVIFSSGLFDYLDAETGARLVRELYDRLAPGGLLAVGNANGPGDHFWLMEFALNWHLQWRDRQAMVDLASGLPPDARTSVELEKEGAFWYLVVRKPGA